ncbi:MAG: alanine--tRNA ligase [Bacilli bacterium]|nr:alanine--tRNA ligase [Bacilli bacterium]
MKKLTGNEIRVMWLDFFKSKGHHVEKGASLIPYKDPSLLWINSGVAALKKYMDGSEVPPSRRITNVQKSIRTNDMDNVGYTSRHHTFFEMLGNFSIGDYFRKEVIPWAFEILTSEKYFAMPVDKLYFTYNPSDKETHDLWKEQGVAEDHLIPLEGNYWEIGEGPAGPNTEVFFDRGEKYDPEHLGIKLLKEEIENDRYIEIWGIVFSQYNAVPGTPRSEYKELPSKNIDTGAGLERIASVLQETPSNFETDLFMPIIKEVEKLANVKYEAPYLTSYRVIADHIRAVTFALSDGEVFSNEGRGYVLRRLVRRAMRFAKKIGINRPFMYTLIPTVVEKYKDFYPELSSRVNVITSLLKNEEEKFIKTLTSGEALLREMIESKKQLSGKDAFKLYDTFGFPLDLTKEICEENGVKVDEEGFEKEMLLQKERARNARSGEQSMHKQSKDLLDFTSKSEFTYDDAPLKAKVIGLFKDGEKVSSLEDEGEVVFDKTNFYAESGGEVADHGKVTSKDIVATVVDVQKAPNKQNLHFVKIAKGTLKVGDELLLEVDHEEREFVKRNHSATHLLQSALVRVLGDHIKQMGSFVSSEYMRFDFTQTERISEIQLDQIENEVNRMIAEAIPSNIRVLPIEEANKLGAKAFFSEKYGDSVRVVAFGDESIEFCGGCHVENTKDIGLFVIESEESIASGVRRIQGRTSIGAYELLKEKEEMLKHTRDALGAKSVAEVSDRLQATLSEKANLKKANEQLLDKMAQLVAESLMDSYEEVNGYKLITKYVQGMNLESLNKIGDILKNKHKDSIIALIGGDQGDLPLAVFISGKPLENNKAGDLLKALATELGGSGGGRPNMANGRGKEKSKIESGLSKVKGLIK